MSSVKSLKILTSIPRNQKNENGENDKQGLDFQVFGNPVL